MDTLDEAMMAGGILQAEMPQAPISSMSGVHSPDLTTEAGAVLDRLREDTAAVLSGFDVDIARSTDLCKHLNINATLGWNVSRVAMAPDGLSAGPYVPSLATMQRFVRAAAEKGASEQTLDRLMASFHEFETLVERHAPDRDAFISMIRDLNDDPAGADDIKHRRAAFRAMRHIMGVQAEAILHLMMRGPAVKGDGIDQVGVKGWIEIQRFRSTTAILSENSARVGEPERAKYVPVPLEPEDSGLAVGLSLLKRFCSQPPPRHQSFVENGTLITQVFSNEVGRGSATTYFLGGVSRNVPVCDESHPHYHASRSYVTVPSEYFIRDIWLHERLWPVASPEAELYYPTGSTSHDNVREVDRLPMCDKVELVGTGVNATMGKEVPRYPELVCYLAEKQGWRIEEFRQYRCKIRYPVLNSVLRIVVPY